MIARQPLLGDYYRYSLALGVRAALRGWLSAAAPRLLNPVSYWRCVEVPWTVEALAVKPADRVLDLGSPKLLSLYIAERFRCSIVAVDILGDFIAPCRVLLRAGGSSAEWGRRYIAMRQDGRALAYGNGSFDKAYAISVVEHIPDDGDAQAMRELARVLKPGGLLAVTVPFAPQLREDWVERDVYERVRAGRSRVFYQRRYDAAALRDRLVTPAGLTLVDEAYFTGFDVWDGLLMRLPMPLRAALAPFQPIPARLMIRRVRAEDASPRLYNLACLLLRKPA